MAKKTARTLPKIRNRFTFSPEENPGEINTEPSMTVPNESRSLKEILDRYEKGQDIKHSRGVYIDAEDLDYINRYYNPGSLDLSDLEQLEAHVNRLQESVETAKATAKQKQAEKPEPTPEPKPEPSEE